MAQDAIIVAGIEQYRESLQKLMTDNPATKKELQRIIRNAIGEARKNVIRDAQDVLVNDPRHAYKAVRNSVYRQIFGGQINILSSSRRGAPTKWVKPKKQRPERARGGNRRKRSYNTMRIDSYEGVDRGFILRFLNAGTDKRETRYGTRGALRPRRWFGISTTYQLEAAANRVTEEVEKLLQQEFHQM